MSNTEPFPPEKNEEGHQAGFSHHSQGAPINTEMAQLPPQRTNPTSVPGSQAQLPPPQNVQLSSSPGQVYFTPDGRVYYGGSQPAPSFQPGATQPLGQMMFIPSTQPGNPQVWPANQQQMVGGTTMQVPYLATQPPPYAPVVTAAGVDLRPPSFIVMTFIVTFICFFLNITTLIFGIPAIILSIASEENKKQGEYSTAKKYGKIALGINIANIIYTAVVALAIVSGVLGGILNSYYYYY